MPLFRRKPKPSTAPAGPRTLPIDPSLGDPDVARLRRAMQARDWPTVRSVLAAVTEPSDHTLLVDLASRIADAEVWLPDIIRAEPDSTEPLLLYGARAVQWAWDARTGRPAKDVGADQFQLFFQRLTIAYETLHAVVDRDPDSVTAWAMLITVARGLQLGKDEARSYLDRVRKLAPDHVGAHRQYLQNVCAKWGGSHEEMHEFARESMLSVPAGSALGHLVAIAAIEHRIDIEDKAARIAYMASEPVRAALLEAADRSVRHPSYRRQRTWGYTHNMFAAAFSFSGQFALANEQFDTIGDQVTEFPWCYFDRDPGAAYCRIRAVARAEG